jgi:hypothetical protein
MKGKWLSVLAVAVALASLGGLIPQSLGAQIVPVGPEVEAGSVTALYVDCPRIAVGPDRSFEIAWDNSTLPPRAAFGRHFTPDGAPSSDAQVQIASSGGPFDFLIVDRVTSVADGFQVYLRRGHPNPPRPPDSLRQQLDPNGDPVGTPELLGSKSQILVGPGGDLYATFYKSGPKILGIQKVAPDGTPRGPQIVLSTRPAAGLAVALAPFPNGDFVVGWLGLTPGKNPRQILRARLVHQGVPVGQEIDLSAPGGRGVMTPRLSLKLLVPSPSGQGFAAVWGVEDAGNADSIHLRFFDAAGRPRTPEVVAVPSAPGVDLQSAALDDAGDLLLLWRPPIQEILRARLFSASTGAPIGPAYQLGRFSAFTCGDLAWTGDSWLITYRTTSAGRNGIVWRRFTE